MYNNKEKPKEIFVSNTICLKSGFYRFVNCDGEEFDTYIIEKRNMDMETMVSKCRFGNKELFLKKGDLFPLCANCNNLSRWEYIKEKPL
jgi:hypothetical protein